jgi:excisionase family DNA binding protein
MSLYSSRKAAAYLDVDEKTFRAIVKSGALVGVYLGSRMKFSDEALQAYIDGLPTTSPKVAQA